MREMGRQVFALFESFPGISSAWIRCCQERLKSWKRFLSTTLDEPTAECPSTQEEPSGLEGIKNVKPHHNGRGPYENKPRKVGYHKR